MLVLSNWQQLRMVPLSPTAVKQFAQVDVSSLLWSSWIPTCSTDMSVTDCVYRTLNCGHVVGCVAVCPADSD